MVVIDTDIFVLAFAFHHDTRQSANANFLTQVQDAQPAITIYNLMELLGQMSFNLSPTQLDDWRAWLISAYHLKVLAPVEIDDPLATIYFIPEIFDRPFAKMRAQRMAFMDALVLSLAERSVGIEAFITWNARHFKGKTTLPVLTPKEFLAQKH
ncbi:hypothetical protein ANRL1_03392 [Anaerolineae bacterium]|nr:hypothetical protein ANRL1_03392 [Anaerolineae bacterium]